MNNITIAFSIDQLNVILGALDQQPHNKVRGLIDYIVNEANAQQQAAQASASEGKAE